jgi:hypothetical protein
MQSSFSMEMTGLSALNEETMAHSSRKIDLPLFLRPHLRLLIRRTFRVFSLVWKYYE